ncbi:MAG TPA: hypothetical protein VG942_12600, partial [Hyphomonadaceae bacterium]|nr:hypothetical protein [Hyphomonadaceae bacterium]
IAAAIAVCTRAEFGRSEAQTHPVEYETGPGCANYDYSDAKLQVTQELVIPGGSCGGTATLTVNFKGQGIPGTSGPSRRAAVKVEGVNPPCIQPDRNFDTFNLTCNLTIAVTRFQDTKVKISYETNNVYDHPLPTLTINMHYTATPTVKTVVFGTPTSTPKPGRGGVEIVSKEEARRPDGMPCLKWQTYGKYHEAQITNSCDRPVAATINRYCHDGTGHNMNSEVIRPVFVASNACLPVDMSTFFGGACPGGAEGFNAPRSMFFANANILRTTCEPRQTATPTPTLPSQPPASTPAPPQSSGRIYVCYSGEDLNFAGCKGRYAHLCNSTSETVTRKVFYKDADGMSSTTRSVTVTAPPTATIGHGAPELVGSSVVAINHICQDRGWAIALPGQ